MKRISSRAAAEQIKAEKLALPDPDKIVHDEEGYELLPSGKRKYTFDKQRSEHLSNTYASVIRKPPGGHRVENSILKVGRIWALDVLEKHALTQTSRDEQRRSEGRTSEEKANADYSAFQWFCDESDRRGFSLDSELEFYNFRQVKNSVVETRGQRFILPFVREDVPERYWVTDCDWKWVKHETLRKRKEPPMLTGYGMQWWKSLKRVPRYLYKGKLRTVPYLAEEAGVSLVTMRKRLSETDENNNLVRTAEEAVELLKKANEEARERGFSNTRGRPRQSESRKNYREAYKRGKRADHPSE